MAESDGEASETALRLARRTLEVVQVWHTHNPTVDRRY
jgi:hypothetical protein